MDTEIPFLENLNIVTEFWKFNQKKELYANGRFSASSSPASTVNYADKTGLLYDLVTKGKIYFLSSPHRFGKSLFNGSNFTDPGALDSKIESCIAEWERIYGSPDKNLKAGDRFAYVLLTGVTKFAQVSVFNFILSGCFLTAARHLRAILLRRTVGDWLIA